MDIRSYLHIVKRYLLAIILFTVLTTILTATVVFMIPPTYKANTTLLVNQASSETINLNDIMTSERLAKTYAEIITKRPIIQEVMKNYGFNGDYEKFLKKLEVQLIRDTQLLSLSVKDTDANRAAQIADDIANKFSEEVINLQGETKYYNTVSIVEKAIPPEKPTSPQKALSISLAFILSFLTITGIIFLIEYLDDTFKDEFDIKEHLGLPHLGTVSYIKNAHRQPGSLISISDPQNAIVESFREIRTNVQFSQPEKSNKSMLVTSSIASEGKSQVSANLAVVMAQAGYKTIIVDADLHRPSQHEIFDVDNSFGLSDILTTNELPSKIFIPTEINGLSIIPSGSFLPNPSEWIGSTKMYHLIEKLKEEKFHTIIFDTPPIGLVTDAAILSSMVDIAILVIEGAKTNRQEVHKATEAIKKVGGEVVGTIINYKKSSYYSKDNYYQNYNK